MASFLNGGATMACLAIALFFLRFWCESRDRLFVWLASGFLAFAINYGVLGAVPSADERQAYLIALRLVGFVAVIVGVVLKNRAPGRSSDRRALRLLKLGVAPQHSTTAGEQCVTAPPDSSNR
jgi:hypothetical protein